MAESTPRLPSQHMRVLEDRAVPVDVAGERGYISIRPDDDLRLAGFAGATKGPGLLIQRWNVHGEKAPPQFRPDRPRLGSTGKPLKYEAPPRKPNFLDVPPRSRPHLGDPKVDLWISVEGSIKADAILGQGLACVVSVAGIWGWRCTNGAGGKVALPCFDSVALNDRQVFLVCDHDYESNPNVPKATNAFRMYLAGRGARVRILYPPGPAGSKTGVDDFLAQGGSLDELIGPLTEERPEPAPEPVKADPCTIEEVLAVFKRELFLPDTEPLLAILGTLAGNLLAQDDPIWLLAVGPPSGGKTEQIWPATALPFVHPAATLTEAALLSGTSRRERAASAKGGLLRSIGDFGVIICKDFGSVLSMNRDTRAALMAALREVFDGSWTRHVGSDGGTTLHWQGKVGLIAGCTPIIDRHHAVMSSLGERFLLVRLPPAEKTQATRMRQHAGRVKEMRADLAVAVAGLFAEPLPDPRPVAEDEWARLVDLAWLVTHCRSSVERDSYSRQIELVPGAEAPGRLTAMLATLLSGLDSIGVDRATAWEVVRRVGLDSMPALRRRVLDSLDGAKAGVETTVVAVAVSHPTETVRRTLQDLEAYDVVERDPQGHGRADHWRLAPWAQEHLTGVRSDLTRNVSMGEPDQC